MQIPDEKDILNRRLKAERRKQLHAAQVTAAEQAKAAGATTAVVTACCGASDGSSQKSIAEHGFTPVTLVVRDLRYFVPNPAYSGGKKKGDKGETEEVPKELELLKGW